MTLIHRMNVPFVTSIALVTALAACGGGDADTTQGAGASGASTSNPNGGSGGDGGDGGDGGLFNNTTNPGGGTTSSTTESGTTTTTAPPDPNGLCLSPAQTDGATLWAKKAGADNVQTALGITTDAQGNVIVAGGFQGSIDFGAGVLTSAGQNDAYVAKLDANGGAVWSKRYGDSGFHQYAQHLATDAQGNILVTGYFRGTINFGGQNLSDVSNFFDDIFIAKLDGAGNHVWSKRYGDINSEQSMAIATDPQSNVLVAGAFQKTINFGGGAIVAEDGGFNAFVAKLSPAGDQVWAKSYGDTAGEQKALGVTADKDGNVYLTGHHRGSIDFGGGALVADGANQNAFIAKLNAQGNVVWAKSYGKDTAAAVDVAVDPNGNVFVVGNFKGTIDFGEGDLVAGVANNVFLIKLDSAGDLVWAKNYGETNKAQEATSIALHGDKPVLLGAFTGKIDFGGGPLSNAGGYDVFLAKLDADGCETHANSYGAAMLERGETLAIDASGNILFAGSFDGTVDFGGGALVSQATDAYVVKTKP